MEALITARRLIADGHYQAALDGLATRAGEDAGAAMLSGVAASRMGKTAVAISHFARASELSPGLVAARLNLGLCLRTLGRTAEAETALRAAVALDARALSPLLALAGLLRERGATDEAAEAYAQVLAIEPQHGVALNNLGLCRRLQGRDQEAIACFAALVELEPGNPDALANLGAVRAAQGSTDAAIDLYRRALASAADHVEAANNLGVALLDKGRAGEAVSVLRRLVDSGRAGAETLANLGNALAKIGDVEGAGTAYDQALGRRPDDGLRVRRALLLPVIVETEEAMRAAYRDFERRVEALRAAPPRLTDPYAQVGATIFNLSYHDACNRKVSTALADIYLSACPLLAWVAPHCAAGRRAGEGPVRIGFVSRHFRTNSVGRCFHGVLRLPNRDDVTVTAFTFGHDPDPLWQSIVADVDRAVVLPASLAGAREAIAAERLDALVYTDIGMEPLTYFLAFARLAPLQCVLGGHPDAVGVPTLDYFVSCDRQEPPGAEAHYRIPLVRLSGAPTYYERPDLPISLKPRSAFGLPEEATLYFCAQTLIKVHPSMDALFRAILERDPRGLLVLPEGYTPELAGLLQARFAKTLGQTAGRVRFLPAISHMDFINVMALADVSLDTRPFGGGNTSWQAIAVGTPMVSWPGDYLRGRYTQALYRMIGGEDAIAGSAEDYIDRAVRFGTDEGFRTAFNARIAAAGDRIFADRVHVDALYDFLVRAARC